MRNYNPHDEFTGRRLEDLSPDELRRHASGLDDMASDIEKVTEKTAEEKEFEANEAQKAAEAEANQQRIAAAGRKTSRKQERVRAK